MLSCPQTEIAATLCSHVVLITCALLVVFCLRLLRDQLLIDAMSVRIYYGARKLPRRHSLFE
jgi:hypothetical protein